MGLALWDAARDGLQEEGCTKVTLWTYMRNDRAMSFFEKAGFKRDLAAPAPPKWVARRWKRCVCSARWSERQLADQRNQAPCGALCAF